MIRQTLTVPYLASGFAADGGTQPFGQSRANPGAAKNPYAAGTKT